MNHRVKQLFVVFISLILLLSQASLAGLQTAYAATLENAVTISAIDEDGSEVLEMTAVEISEGDTAFDVLKKADGQLEYDTHGEFGAFITGINGVQADDQSFWSFFVNGKSQNVGVSSTFVSHGDNILFVLLEEFPPEYYEVTVSATDSNGNPVIEEHIVSMPKNTTAYDALRAAAAEQNVEVNVSIDSQWLTFLNDLNNTLAPDCEYWAINLNGEYMNVGLLGHFVQDGDRLDLYVDNYCEEDPIDEDDNGNEAEDPADDNGDKTEEGETGEDKNLENTVEYEAALGAVVDYLKENPNEINWYGFTALMSASEDFSTEMADDLAASIDENFTGRATDYASAILVLSASGYDATDINGVNLVARLLNENMPTTNFLIFSLLALDSANYEVPEGTEWTRESLIEAILEMELDAGGWSFYGPEPSPDITGMALLALSPYQDRENVKNVIDRAVQTMSELQGEKGGYDIEENGGYSAESAAMVIIGLSALGIDATSDAFTKAEGNLLEHLLHFQMDDGSFKHLLDDETSSVFATNQAALALVAYDRMKEGKEPVFKYTVENKKPSDKPDDDDNDKQTNEDSQTIDDRNGVTGEDYDQGEDIEDKNDGTAAETDNDSDGKPLPKTATNLFNYLLIGFLSALTGIVLYVIQRKKALQ